MADDATTRSLQTLANDLKEEISGVQKVEADLQDIERSLEKIQSMYNQYEQVFAAIDGIDFTNFQSATPQRQYKTISRLDDKTGYDLTDPSQAEELEQVIKKEYQAFERMLGDIQEVEDLLGTMEADDQEVANIINKLEEHFEQMEHFVEAMETLNSNQ